MIGDGVRPGAPLAEHPGQVLAGVFTGVPAKYRRRLMVTCDSAGASHGLIGYLDALASRPGRQLTYSVGWDLDERERTAIRLVPARRGRTPSTRPGRCASAALVTPAPRCPARIRGAGSRKPTSPS